MGWEVPVDLGELMLVGQWTWCVQLSLPLTFLRTQWEGSGLPSLNACDKGTAVGAMPADSTGLSV